MEEDAPAELSGTTSLAFSAGNHHQVTVKVIDPRGNEVMGVHSLSREIVYSHA